MTVTLALVTIAAGFGVGILAALFGVGGGLLMVPFMVLVLEKTQHLAEGTSLAVIVPTAIVGVIAHMKRGYVSLRDALWLALGGIGGAVIGARLALATPADTLETIFGVFVIAIGVRFVVQGVKTSRSSPSGDR
jgi:uncharacterized membrane protein YfcA